MASKDARGTKRTCQNDDCGSHFYDLSRNPINCPICGSPYVIASSPIPFVPAEEVKVVPKPKKEFAEAKEDAEEDELSEAEDIEVLEEGETIADDDDAFLEEDEEEDGNVPGIIVGGSRAGGNEEV